MASWAEPRAGTVPISRASQSLEPARAVLGDHEASAAAYARSRELRHVFGLVFGVVFAVGSTLPVLSLFVAEVWPGRVLKLSAGP